MVLGFKLALRREIVSRPPEKMCSTATADPGYISSENELHGQVKDIPGIERISRASFESLGNLELQPPQH
jgi:hypothetical protein